MKPEVAQRRTHKGIYGKAANQGHGHPERLSNKVSAGIGSGSEKTYLFPSLNSHSNLYAPAKQHFPSSPRDTYDIVVRSHDPVQYQCQEETTPRSTYGCPSERESCLQCIVSSHHHNTARHLPFSRILTGKYIRMELKAVHKAYSTSCTKSRPNPYDDDDNYEHSPPFLQYLSRNGPMTLPCINVKKRETVSASY